MGFNSAFKGLKPLTDICEKKNSKNYDWKIQYSNFEYTLVHPNSIICVVHVFKGFLNDISELPSVGSAHPKLPALTYR